MRIRYFILTLILLIFPNPTYANNSECIINFLKIEGIYCSKCPEPIIIAKELNDLHIIPLKSHTSIRYFQVLDQKRPDDTSRKGWYEPIHIIQPLANVGLYKYYYYTIESRPDNISNRIAIGIRSAEDFESECFPKKEKNEIKKTESNNLINIDDSETININIGNFQNTSITQITTTNQKEFNFIIYIELYIQPFTLSFTFISVTVVAIHYFFFRKKKKSKNIKRALI